MKAAVSRIIPKNMRSTGFGIAWFLGSWLLGALYDINVIMLVVVSIAAQLIAVMLYMVCIRTQKG